MQETRCRFTSTTLVGVLLGVGVASTSLPATDTVRIARVVEVLLSLWSDAASGSVHGGDTGVVAADSDWCRLGCMLGLGVLSAHAGQGLAVSPAMHAALAVCDVAPSGTAAGYPDVHCRVVHALFSSATATAGASSVARAGAMLALAHALQAVPASLPSSNLFGDVFRCLHHDALVSDSGGAGAVAVDAWLAVLPLLPAASLHRALTTEQVPRLSPSCARTSSRPSRHC